MTHIELDNDKLTMTIDTSEYWIHHHHFESNRFAGNKLSFRVTMDENYNFVVPVANKDSIAALIATLIEQVSQVFDSS